MLGTLFDIVSTLLGLAFMGWVVFTRKTFAEQWAEWRQRFTKADEGPPIHEYPQVQSTRKWRSGQIAFFLLGTAMVGIQAARFLGPYATADPFSDGQMADVNPETSEEAISMLQELTQEHGC